ncbi:MAG: PKD domain-containing protein [Bacteroidetes bacterium]|nr:PKD domain-containing protein [Bacteroidota bacterium]
MNNRIIENWLAFSLKGWFKFLMLFIALISSGVVVWAQTSISSIPVADENGEIHVCLGSAVLFSHDTPEWQLVGSTEFNWDFDYQNQTASTAGPHAILFDSYGTFEVSLSIITYDGEEDLGTETLTVVVEDTPPIVPTLGPGNPCTFVDTLFDESGEIDQIIFQTQNGDASCTCFNDNVGPAVSMLDTDEYPEGTISIMWWGGAGTTGVGGTGGTAPYTVEDGPFPLADPSIFNGQNVFGHYADQGSYNLMHVVEFPNGCTYSAYYVMSWGAAEIDFGSSQAQSVCFPLEYPLGFDIQSPGTTYQIEWGDGFVEEYVYPDLPVLPNVIGHQYAPSCDSIGEAEAYTITVRATNSCTVDTTITTQGPFYVSTPPTPEFEMIPGDVVCQFETIIFSELIEAGFEASGGSCSDDHMWEWWIEGENELSGYGYEVIAGGMGDIFNLFAPPVSGTNQIEVYFDQPGNYTVTLSVLNDFCNPTSISHTVQINPVPQVEDLELTICNYSGFDTLPGPPNIVPPGTIFDWTAQSNPFVEGEMNGSGTSIYADLLINTTNVTQTVIYDVIPTAPGNCVGEPFTVTVEVVPGIEISDYTVVVCNGGGFSIDPSNSANNIVPDGTTYEWTVTDNPNITGESPSNGPQATVFEDALTTSVIQPIQSVEYIVTATAGLGCEDETFVVTAYVNDVDAGVISEDQIVCPGGDPFPLVFSQSAIGSGTSLTYQWQQAPTPAGPWTNINLATSPSYDPPAGILDDTYFRVVVTSYFMGVSCSETTNVVQVEVNYLSQPEIAPSQVFCAGEDPGVIELIDPIDAFGDVTYQWQSATSLAGPWNNIPGQTNASYDPPPLNSDLYIRVIVTSTADDVECALVSDSVLLDVNEVDAGTLTEDQTICEGEIPNLMVVNGQDAQGDISYQWYSSSASDGTFAVIPGANQSSYQPPTGLFQDIYYQVQVFSEFNGVVCSDWTNVIWIQVNNVDNGVVPFVQHICEGGDPSILQFDQLPQGDGVLTYQWQLSTDGVNWTNIPGANSSSYNPPGGLLEDTEYQVLITSTLNGVSCTILSQLFQVNVMSLDPGTIAEGQQICAGGDPDPLYADVPPVGEGSLSYQWQITTELPGSWSDIPGAIGLNYNPPGPIFETTYYQLVVTNTIGVVSCTEETEPVVIEVYDDPAIVTQPLDFQEICIGGSIDALEVAVESEPWLGDITYQWYDDNGFIFNETGSSHTPPVFNATGTFEFYVEVTWSGEGCDGVISNVAEVEVVPDPVVTIGPADASYCQDAPSDALNAAISGGLGTASYQWYVNSSNSNQGGTLVSGAIDSDFFPPTDVIGTFYYYCVVDQSVSGCQGVSNVIAIEITPGPSITSDFDDQEVCVGGSLDTWTVTYQDGTGNPSYQWYVNSSPSINGASPIGGEITPTYTPPSSVAGIYYYTCVISFDSGGCDEIIAPFATVLIAPDPLIITQPLDGEELCVGGTLDEALYIVYSGGLGSPTYQWFVNGSPISNSNAAGYQPPIFDVAGSYFYEVELTVSGLGCDAVTSNEAEVIVFPDPTVVDQPISATYCIDATATDLMISAEGGVGTFEYQWYVNDLPTTLGADAIAGENATTFTPPTDVLGTLHYYCEVTQTEEGCGVLTDLATITVLPSPEISSQPMPDSVCVDGFIDDLFVEFEEGVGVPTYQWFANSIPSMAGATQLVGETGSTYSPPTDIIGTTWYTCVLNFPEGGCGSLTAEWADIVVTPSPIIVLDPLETDTICVGGSLYFPLDVAYDEGTGIASYQWYTGDGAEIAGANESTYMPPAFDLPGTYEFYVQISLDGNGCDPAVSQIAEVIVVEDPVVTLQPVDSSYCQGAPSSSVAFLAVEVAGGTGTFSYQWYVSSTASNTGGTAIGGATASTYLPPVDVVGTLYYYCLITQSGANCEVVSEVAEIVVNEAPAFTMVWEDQEVCLDGSLDAYTVTYDNGTGVPSYQWYWNGVASNAGGTALVGETSSTFQPLSDASWLGETWYYCEVTFSFGGCEMITSSPVLVNVVSDPSISVQPLATDTLCVGGTPYLPLSVDYVDGTGDVSYQWYTGGGVAIGGATSSSYLPPTLETPSDFEVAGTYEYYVTVTLDGSGCDVATSDTVEVIVVEDPVVTLQPVDSSYCQGAAIVDQLIIEVTGGTGTFSYQWYVSSTASNTGGTAIGGATASTYLPPVDVVGTFYYYCLITQSGANCEVVSEVAEIVVNEAPQFTQQPQTQTLCFGETATTLGVDYQFGTGIPSYQWYESAVNAYSGAPIQNATDPTYDPPASAPGSLYYYCIITFDGGGCEEITSNIAGIHVNDIVIGTIEADQEICFGETPALFEESSATTGVGLLTYQWLSGVDSPDNPQTIIGANQSTYQSPALFDTTFFMLEVTSTLNGVSCIDTTNSVEIIVFPLPIIEIGPPDTFCANDGIVELTEFSPQGPDGGFWEGPGVVDVTGGLFDVNGPQTGVGEWELFFWYEDLVTGCRDTLWHDVTVNPIPTADFAVPELACNNFPIDIDQNSLNTVSAAWDFGNGDEADVINPIYTYPDAGVYEIELIVENVFGCFDTTYAETEITYPPTADFFMPVDSACAPLIVEFVNNSDAPFATHEWMLGDSLVSFDFEDPDGDTPLPTLFEQGPAIAYYDVTLEVENICGVDDTTQVVTVYPLPQMSFILQEDTACSPFTANILNTSVGLPDDIQWDFGNGQTESGTISTFPTYFVDPDSSAQTFIITVVGTNQCGVDSASAPIFIYPNTIQAFFQVDIDEGCAPLEVTATDMSVETTSIQFDFGNGTVTYDSISTVIFEEAGLYTITQYVTNGCSIDETSIEIDVWPQPDFTLTSDDSNYCEGETATISIISDDASAVDWDFGQGETGFGETVTTVYDDSGVYTVTALVTSGINGCQAEGELPIIVDPTPELDIIPDQDNGCTPLTVAFDNNSVDTDFWDWQFGDDGTSANVEPNHTFINPTQDPMTFTVEIYASNLEGCEAEDEIEITVLPAPEVAIGGIQSQYCGVPASIFPTNETQFALEYEWSLDDQVFSTEFQPSFEINEAGTFMLALEAFNEYNCSAVDEVPVVVYYNPIPALNISPIEGCPPLSVFIQDVSVGAAQSDLTITFENEVVYQGPPITNYYVFEETGLYSLDLYVISGVGCEVTDNVGTVTVFPEPFAYFEANPYDSEDTSPDLPSSINTEWSFDNLSNGNEENYWLFGDGGASTEEHPIHNYYDPGTYGVTLEVTNEFGCTDEHSEWLVIQDFTPIYVPNSFTPGGMTSKPDGLNDAFRAEFKDYSLVTDYSLQIFDRWGELIWESEDPEEFWLGNVRHDGIESEYFVKMDVYTWKIRYSSTQLKGTYKELTGHVTIVR